MSEWIKKSYMQEYKMKTIFEVEHSFFGLSDLPLSNICNVETVTRTC